MRTRIYLMSFIFLLGLLLFMVTKQITVDFYWTSAHQDGKELKKTVGYLEKCIVIDPKNALFHFSLGRAFLQKGLEEATRLRRRNKWVIKSIDEFHRAIELEPSNSDYHFHLGISYGCLTYPPPLYWNVIQSSFKRTAMLNPTDVRHLHSIGEYYLNEYRRLKSIGMYTDEIGSANYNNYKELLRDNYQFYFQLKRIRTLLAAGRLDEAIDEYHNIMKKDPNLSKLTYDTMRHYQKKKNYPEATRILNEAISSILN